MRDEETSTLRTRPTRHASEMTDAIVQYSILYVHVYRRVPKANARCNAALFDELAHRLSVIHLPHVHQLPAPGTRYLVWYCLSHDGFYRRLDCVHFVPTAAHSCCKVAYTRTFRDFEDK
jgi:hypothetical protein